MSNRETLFITGFPGFIADRLLERLAKYDCRFLLLVQPPFLARARDEIARIAGLTGKPVEQFQIVEGDITHAELGLSPLDAAEVREETTRVFHLAAIYDLAVARQLALHVNMVGTMHVLQFAQLMPNLRHFHYVSTCYVAGKREGVILETELRHDAGYRNFYEESKYLAEMEAEISEKGFADHDSSSGSGVWRFENRRDNKVRRCLLPDSLPAALAQIVVGQYRKS